MSISSITTRNDASPYAYGIAGSIGAQSSTAGQSNTDVPSATSGKDSFRGDFASLLAAVRAGDIGSAQSALTSLQSDLSSNGSSYNPASTPSSNSTPGQTGLDALFQAVKSGNLSAAQTALSNLQSDVRGAVDSSASNASDGQSAEQAAPAARHHRHHHGGGGLASMLDQALASTNVDGTTTDSDASTAPGANPLLSL